MRNPTFLKALLNVYPPYLGAGVRVRHKVEWPVEILDEAGEVVARAEETVYVRRKGA